MADKKERTNYMTPIFRVSFPQLFEAKAFGNSDPKFSVVAIIPKDVGGDDKAKLGAMVKAAEKASIDRFGEAEYRKLRKLGKFKWPFRDGEEKDLEGYGPGVLFLTLSTKMPPGVIGRNKEYLEERDVYAGCYARATVSPYAFDNRSKGVAFGLNNLQKVGDGESFSQRTAAEEDFEEVDDSVFVDDYAAPFDAGKAEDDFDPLLG